MPSNQQDILALLCKDLPHLEGKLSVEKIVYHKNQNRVYFSFLSTQLVGEKDYLHLLQSLKKQYPGLPISLRVASPSLGKDFLANIHGYKQVLIDFLIRTYPSAKAWLDAIDWEATGGQVILTFPDDFSMNYMKTNNISSKLSKAIWDIFRLELSVELRVKGNQEARIEALIKEREEALLKEQQVLFSAISHSQSPSSSVPSKKSSIKKSANICGRGIADASIPINELTTDAGLVTVEGEIISVEKKELKGGELLLITFAVTDYTSTIGCKMFLRYRKRPFGKKAEDIDESPITPQEKASVDQIANRIEKGEFVKVRGECAFDTFAKEITISVRDMVEMPKQERLDTAKEKRIELHMHTHMSTMDALAPPGELIARAAKWGHPAVAITDHGVLQAFPAAFSAAKKHNIKLLPGVEGYLTEENPIVNNLKDYPLEEPVVVLDFETTGLNTKTDCIIEIGAVKLYQHTIIDSYGTLVNPKVSLEPIITKITGITDMMLRDQPLIEEAFPKLLDFIGNCPIVAHNASFDVAMLESELKRQNRILDVPQIDTLTFSRKLYPQLRSHRLKALCKHLGVSLKDAHRAVNDATATAQCLDKMLNVLKEQGATQLEHIDQLVQGGAIGERNHVILLAATPKGMENLNHLVSISHLEYFQKRPHMPKAILQKYREGLIVGSACEAGELFQAVLKGRPESELKKIARFYDYLEIQPTGNNAFLLRNGLAKDMEELRSFNKTIVALGEKLGIPVVATGDVHFLDPKDAICRSILQAGQGYSDSDEQPPLYFKTTDEMLEEFSYLGKEKAHEVVIKNPGKIADKVEDLTLFPKHPKGEDTFQPYWEDAKENIENMSWGTAKNLYGENLPDIVVKRLEKELSSIIGYGFATLYMIAHMLVKKSLDDGYVVGSRGSVGSSFVATMCGITEVNPLPPHYRCSHCHIGDFDVEKEKYKVGPDLPDKLCPSCGKPFMKDGFDIPFEVFLGFKGDKVPDIDLNFSGVYQPVAHAYVEELFGKNHVFRAGTISALADKTAYGYVSNYLEERGIYAGNAEKMRLVGGCVGVKRTTGQHPGGMVVVPQEYDVHQFTAIQHPADDKESGTITTHYDFNSMHDILVKLDILGHDDPTMIHMLERLTNTSYQDIPLTDPTVMSLFQSPKALGVTKEEINSSTGTYGVPEFGTAFVRQMLDDTRPSTMEELIRISGLSHGTDVWLGNARDLITSGTAVLSECICTRDDIMNTLITIGLDSKMAFDIMENVRKGKGLSPQMEEAMVTGNVQPWFIDSCKKIKYMFPKGHAVAYVTMALRIAWYKVYYPLAYYAAYFTVRGDGFDSSRMLLSAEVIQSMLDDMEAAQQNNFKEKLSAKDKEEATALEIVLEMLRRGFTFLPVDLYKSHVSEFIIEGNALRVPFTSVGGLGIAAAQAIAREREQLFLSVEDLKNRTRISTAVIDELNNQGCLSSLSATSQVDLFSFL